MGEELKHDNRRVKNKSPKSHYPENGYLNSQKQPAPLFQTLTNFKMKKHFLLTCLAYMYLGFGMAVQQFGIKAGLGLKTTIIIFISSMVFWFIVVITSMEKVKEILFKEPEHKFDFENEKPTN